MGFNVWHSVCSNDNKTCTIWFNAFKILPGYDNSEDDDTKIGGVIDSVESSPGLLLVLINCCNGLRNGR